MDIFNGVSSSCIERYEEEVGKQTETIIVRITLFKALIFTPLATNN